MIVIPHLSEALSEHWSCIMSMRKLLILSNHKRSMLILLLVPVIAAVLFAALMPQDDAEGSASDYQRGNIRLITDDGGRVDWQHDGAKIYFDRKGSDSYWDAWRMNPDGSGQECLTCDHPGLPNKQIGNPEMHPDGRYLLFQAEKAQHTGIGVIEQTKPGQGRYNDIWAMDLQSQTQNPGYYDVFQLTDVDPDSVSGVLHIRFNSDGTKVLWTDIEGPRPKGIKNRLFSDTRLAVAGFIPGPPPRLDNENIVYYNPGIFSGFRESHGWGPDDSWIYFSCVDVEGASDAALDICRMDIDFPDVVTRLTLTSGENGEPEEWDEHAHLSPLGDAFVWISSQPYGTPTVLTQITSKLKTDLWMMNVDGSAQRRITYFNEPGQPDYNLVAGERAIVSDNDWSSDTTQVVMYIQFPGTDKPHRIYAIDLVTGPPNGAPTANDHTATTDEDTSVSVTLTATDPEQCELTFSIVNGPANGSLSAINEGACEPGSPNLDSASVIYTPNDDYNGEDSFTYKANDGIVDSPSATVTITVIPTNDTPVADDQSVTTFQDTPIPVTLTGSDVDGDTLTFSVVTDTTNGVLSGVAPDLTYTPNSIFTGDDSFAFKANDGTEDSNIATITISVTVPPTGSANDMYVWDIEFESRTRGGRGGVKHDERIIVTIRRDSNANGVAEIIDDPAADVSVAVELQDSTGGLVASLSGTTDSQGVFRTAFIGNLTNDDYLAEVTALGHNSFVWNKALDPTANDTDTDGDTLPDQQHAIPH